MQSKLGWIWLRTNDDWLFLMLNVIRVGISILQNFHSELILACR